jgi:hypothetical protein
MMHTRGVVIAAALLAAVACKTSSGAKPASTARAGDDRADSATRDGQRVAVEADPQAGQSERAVAEAQAAEQAPSVRPTEGGGGKDPHPLPTEENGKRTYGGDQTAGASGQAGRVPQGMPGQPGAPGTAGAPQDRLEGRVALVDAQNHEIAVDSGQATQQVKVDPSADITVDGKKAAFSDLKQGQEVRVSLDQGSDGPAAKKIEVTHKKK